MSERRYNDDEFALILKRASDTPTLEGSTADGTSLDELERLAEAANLDPDLIHAALTQVQMERGGLWERLIRAPSRFFEERRFGWELPEGGNGRLIAALRRVVGQQGKVDDVLGGLEWKTGGSGLTSMHARIQSEDGETRVEVMRDHGQVSGLTIGLAGPFAGLLAGMMLAASAGMGPTPSTFAAMGAGVVAGTGAAWWWYRRLVAKSRALLERVMDELSRETRALSAGQRSQSAEGEQRAPGAPSADADFSPDQ